MKEVIIVEEKPVSHVLQLAKSTVVSDTHLLGLCIQLQTSSNQTISVAKTSGKEQDLAVLDQAQTLLYQCGFILYLKCVVLGQLRTTEQSSHVVNCINSIVVMV